MIPLEHYLWLSGMLFTLGLFGVMTRRNVILVLMSVEIMLNAANVALVAFNKHLAIHPPEGVPPDGQVFVFTGPDLEIAPPRSARNRPIE